MPKVSSKLKKSYSDAIIVGGGLVGAAVAHSLAFSGLDVALIDKEKPETWLSDEFDGRASAVALSSKRYLDAIGLCVDTSR